MSEVIRDTIFPVFSFYPPAEHSLGLAYLKLGRYDEAIEHLSRAAAQHPSRPSLQADLEHARKKRGA